MKHFFSRIKLAYDEDRLFLALRSRLKVYIQGFKYVFHDPASNNVVLHFPDYVKPLGDTREIELVERIFQSFKKMKNDQKTISNLYLPSSIWQKHIDIGYSYLSDALQSNHIDKFHFFLSNFGSWKQDLGIEANMLIKDNMADLIRRRYLKNVIFHNNFKNWNWIYNNSKSVSCLTYPIYGNQPGAFIEDTFVGAGSFFSEFYGSMLNELLDDVERPVVADLGAGYGKLAFFILRNNTNSCFLDFDLPETLCLAAYYLMKTWPNKRTLLYGEEKYSSRSHNEYELIFMPSYELVNVGERSIDLFINKNSLGEMTREAAINYVGYIAKATRYFFHMNHDVFPNVYTDNSPGLLGYEYPIPKDEFKLLFRYPEFGHMLHHGKFDYLVDIFLYLYERRS